MPKSTQPSNLKRTTTSTRTTTTSRAKSAVDALAANLEANLAITSTTKGKQKAIPAESMSPEKTRLSAMRNVNKASHSLSSVVQSGWKASSEQPKKKSATLTSVSAAVSAANRALEDLREICPDDLDVERAASSIVGKLITLGVYESALAMLAAMRPRLVALTGAPPENTLPVSLPLPRSAPNTTALTLISTYLLHALTLAAHNHIDTLSDALSTAPTLVTWMPHFACLPEKHTDALLTRAYTVLTKACATPDAAHSPCSILLIRMYSLRCLLCTSPGTVQPTTFWDQAQKFSTLFVRVPSKTETETDAAGLVSGCIEALVRAAPPEFLQCTSFVGLCEFWMGFAKRGRDMRVLDRITDLMQSTPPNSQGTSVDALTEHVQGLTISSATAASSSGDHHTRDTVFRESAAVCATFVKATTSIEGRAGTDAGSEGASTGTYPSSTGVDTNASNTDNGDDGDDLRRAAGKLDRALERLRRAAIRVLDGGPNTDLLTDAPTTDLITSALDAYFVLARRAGTDAPDAALRFLARATSLVGGPLPPSFSTTTSAPATSVPAPSSALPRTQTHAPHRLPAAAHANYLRCISGAHHNLAGGLYHAGRYGAAVPFARAGCVLGGWAAAVRAGEGEREEGKGPEDEREKEGWRQLEEQLYRRWELLGVCYAKIGDRRPAYEAFRESVKSFPYALPGVGVSSHPHSQTHSHTQALDATPGLKQLGGIVDRLTYIGACELFLGPDEVSLRGCFQAPLPPAPPILAHLLERQLSALEAHMRKDGVRAVVVRLLADALRFYEAHGTPVGRARMLLRCVEFVWRGGGGEGGAWDGEELGREALSVLASEDLGHDAPLAAFVPQYIAAAHFWLALFAYRRQETSGVAYHAEEGCRVLRSIAHASANEAVSPKPGKSPKAARQVKTSPMAARPAKKSPKPKQIAASKRTVSVRQTKKGVAATKAPVTPRVRKVLQSVSINVAQASPPRADGEVNKAVAVIENFEGLLGLLQMNAHLLGLLGLVLLKVKLLEITKRLCEQQPLSSKDAYMTAAVDLTYEYLKLGKTKRAGAMFARSLSIIESGDVSDDVRVRYLLRYAEALALADNVPLSASSYCEAMALAEVATVEEKSMTSAQRIRARVGRLERAAMAAHVFAVIQYSKNNVVDALKNMMQALRLWNRAVDALARLNPPTNSGNKTVPDAEDSNPFEVSGKQGADGEDGQSSEQLTAQKAPARRNIMDGMEWRMIEGLLGTLLALTQAYFARGSSREAEYFAQQALDLAESVGAPAMAARALTRKAEIQLLQGHLEAGHESVRRAAELLEDIPGTEAADVRRLRADFSGEDGDARGLYEEATAMLEELERMFAGLDGGRRKSSLGVPPRSSLPEPSQGTVVPALLSAILRRHIWLLRDNADDAFKNLLDRLQALPASPEIKGEENALMGKLTLHGVYEQFRADMFLSSLAESTIAIPMGMSSSKTTALAPATDILGALDDAEKLFWADLVLTSRRGNVPHVREAAVSLAMIRALQTSLGRAGKEGPVLAARLLDSSTAITLQRELLEAIQHKFLEVQDLDDLQWPLMTLSGSPLPRPKPRAQTRFNRSPPDSEDDSEGDDSSTDRSLKSYWETIRAKYESHTLDATTLSAPRPAALPTNWTVVNISLTEDKSTMFVCRQRVQSEPLVFCVPLKGRRETEDDEHLAFEDALNELGEIIRLSDQGTRQAVHVKNDDPQARTAWWADRIALDKRMQELLENIEFCWLGAFKTILSQPVTTPTEIITDLRTRLDKVFKRSLPPQDKKQKSKTRLDDSILECFSSLSPKCRDEELEDLVYFILDLYQFHGVPVVISEVDVDQVTVDLRAALEEHALKRRGKVVPEEDSHLFLVLDKNVQGIPWESLPVLRGRSVSRIPSMEFLLDRLQLAELQRGSGDRANAADTRVDRAIVNPRKTFYVLNPSGDLKGTEGRFAPWLKDMHEVGWEGVIGRPPSEQQFLDALARKDLVVYFGHGGGEQYVRSHKIRHLPRCAATMLWGCSSGALKDMGEFDRVGTPYNYMLAGCPTLVANLWDVTDRDIDKFSQAVFDKLRLTAEGVGRSRVDGGDLGTSLVAAVAQSRQTCKLKYLTGAAPVVYGIPFYL
ncbi:hypothetical protein BV22DRAFT_1001613 [Leucogyrophana mollusca]|uniref:Uncharacterized protein n=1 Tax=Leucogyrophana mollusca TaxID=85980 RepID=A0ACB8BWD2_9AGAM|nr:hypothetical protein BV22DRAFT_1001613 [Leucogyrophana mollusca]